MAESGLKFPFSFSLPHDEIPCSYEGKSGNIRYSIKAVIKRHSLLLKMVYVTQQVYFIVKAVVDLSKDVSTLVKVEIYFLLGIVSHFKTFLNRSFHCVNRFQNPSRSGLCMADAWLDRTNGYTFQVKRSSSKPTSTISVVNLYVEPCTVQLIRRLFNLLLFIQKWLQICLIRLYVNSTRRSPMGNTRTKWRKFFGKVKGRKIWRQRNSSLESFPRHRSLCSTFSRNAVL
jgi:hypothetical protein